MRRTGQGHRQQHRGHRPDEVDEATRNEKKQTPASVTTPSGGVSASFTAVAHGQATLSASDDPTCRDTTPPCEIPSRLWQVVITVAG